MKKLDRTALFVITACQIALGGIILFGSRQPVKIICENPDCAQISPLGKITFKFSRAVDQEKAEALLQTDPAIAGRWEWQDERHATWSAATPLAAGQTLKINFNPGKLGKNGESLEEGIAWEMQVRQPAILALKTADDQGAEVYRFDLTGQGEPMQFSQTDAKVFDFNVAPDGEHVVLSVNNEKNGADLWVIKRDGSGQRKLLDCGSDRCSMATWSPAANEIAYTRESSGLDPQGSKGVPRTWIMDVDSGETAPLFGDNQKTGYGPLWSPDGQWLSVWNGVEGGIQIINRQNGEISLLPTQSGDTGCWSADSSALYYTNLVIGESSFHNVISKADIVNGTIQTVMGGNIAGEGLSYDNPACHPVRNLLAASVQPNPKVPGKNLVVQNLDSGEVIQVMSDLTKFPGNYSWNPGGEYLLFQMNVVSRDKEDFEIWIRNEASQETDLLAKGFWFPAWLP